MHVNHCNSLQSLPDISKWNTSKVTTMNGVFSRCCSLKSLPDISKWNINNINDMSWIFNGCEILNSLPHISKWYKNIANDKYIMNMNKIDIIINIDKNEINKKIYFLDNYYYDENHDKKYTNDHLKELNENNTELYINNKKMEKYEKYFIPEKEGAYKIELRFDIYLTDCSYMFSGCEKIKYIITF